MKRVVLQILRLGVTLTVLITMALMIVSLREDLAAAREGAKPRLDGYLACCRSLTPDEFSECATSWDAKSEYRVVWTTDRFFSFRALEYEFRGGAHGSTAVTVGTIDRADGRRLALADVFRPEALTTLERLLRGEIDRQGVELQAEVHPIENFFFDGEGAHFVYNQYEIACYAAGIITADVSWGRLEPLLKDPVRLAELRTNGRAIGSDYRKGE